MPSQRGSLISGQADPPYRFQPIDQRARSASGYVDDYYGEPDERSFICSKPGFVCAAAVVFTVSFIALAFFIESGWPQKVTANNTDERVAGAGYINPFQSGRESATETPQKLLPKQVEGKAVRPPQNNEKGQLSASSTEEPGLKNNHKEPETEDVTEQPRRPPIVEKPSIRNISDFAEKVPKDTLYIYAPFDDARSRQKQILRFLMDAQRFSLNCFPNFTFQEVAEFFQVDQSSESEEKNIHGCANLDNEGFINLKDHFKNDFKRNSKYLFVVRDPRSLIRHAFDKHGNELENCRDNISHRCLYNEEILNNAKKTVEDWNKTTTQMIEVCKKLKRDTCRIILVERLILRLTETLDELAKFLMMDDNKDVYRMLKKIIQKIDEDQIQPDTDKQKSMVGLLDFLLTDISTAWPWSGQLPFNVYQDLPKWAPLMGEIGYGFTREIPDMGTDRLAKYMEQ